MKRTGALSVAIIVLLLLAVGGCATSPPMSPQTFLVVADMREFVGASEFEGAVAAAAAAGSGAFMLSPGDIDPPQPVYDTIRERLGAGFDWYPVVGNHEAETPEDMAWLRGYTLPGTVNPGPGDREQTCYSFDWGKAHFAVIDEYYDGTANDYAVDGDVTPALLVWLDDDLAATTQPVIFVVGHEPAYPQWDQESHRLRHAGDSLDQFPTNRDAFWKTLVDHKVKAYLCGHTHNYSVVLIDGVWQIDCGHARGTADTGARSTFMRITVDDAAVVSYETWRLDLATMEYEMADAGRL